MENRILKNDAQSFLHLAKQRDKAERMNRFFAQRVGTEEVSRREENVKYFDMGMNRRQAVVYSEPVHFRNADSERRGRRSTTPSKKPSPRRAGRCCATARTACAWSFPSRWTAATWRP